MICPPGQKGASILVSARTIALSIVFIAAAAATDLAEEQQRPNVLLILADDLGFECLGCYGGKSYRTPNLDALARSGLRFEQCHSTPLCSPSRVQLMTGRYPFRTGWIDFIGRGKKPLTVLDPGETTFGHILRDAGYATGVSGKWQLANFADHPDHVRACGFDEYCCWAWVYGKRVTSRYWQPTFLKNGKLHEDVDKIYGPDVFCDFLIEFMERHRSRPFFAYYPMLLTHNPAHATPETAVSAQDRRARRRGRPEEFAAMVAYMDRLVGRVIAALDRLQLRDRTIVLFTADNGTPKNYQSRLGDRKVRGGKGTMTDAGTRVPLIVNWPGVTPPNRTCADLVDFSDFLPTILELTGARLPPGRRIDGRSFAPQIRGEEGKPREWVFVQYRENRFVRGQRWKLHGDGRLYDIRRDPFEEDPPSRPVDHESAAAAAARKRLQGALDRLK